MSKLDFPKFINKLKTARFQFLAKTKNGIYFINVQNYTTFNYNEAGFVARHEGTGRHDVILFNEVQEIIVDSKKFCFKDRTFANKEKSNADDTD